MDALRGQTAVITGATGGVGQALAHQLVVAGASVVLVARHRADLDALVRERGWDRTAVECLPVDLTDESGVVRCAGEIQRRGRRLDLLVHAAGTIARGTIETQPVGVFDAHYQVNVRAPYQLTQALLPRLIESRGQVVFINSSVGLQARGGAGQYAATKHALRAVADALREEVNERGVRVLSVFLGRTASRMQEAIHREEQRPYDPARLLQPADVASMVVAALALPRTAEVTDLHIRPMLKH